MTNKNKWCKVCGGFVDLRKKESFKLKEEYTPINKRYGFICSLECHNKLKKQLREMKGGLKENGHNKGN